MEEFTDAFLKRIGEYILVETPLARADVCILFGNPHADHLAEGAAELYHQGYFERIISTGGVPTDDGRLEAHRMRDVLIARGVPEENIIVEGEAQSTIENVRYSKLLLDEKIGLENIRSVLAVGHIHASRRFLMTLERLWPEVTKMFTTSNCFGVPRELWHTHPDFRRAVLFEYERMPKSLKKGLICEIDLERLGREIALLKPPARR